MVNNGFFIGLIGFIGRIVGAIITNSIIRWLKKKSEKKDQISLYKEEIKEILTEFCDVWGDYRVSIFSHSDAIKLKCIFFLENSQRKHLNNILVF